MTRIHPTLAALGHACAIAVSLVFLFPFAWMLSSALRSTRAIMSAPLHLWPESFDLSGLDALADAGGLPIARSLLNSVVITGFSTLLAVVVSALAAYAMVRRPQMLFFRALRAGFLLTIMYPYMLLLIPVYVVMYRLGLLGGYTGIILFLALGPVQLFLFEQFFQTLPAEVLEAARLDGASELQTLVRVVLPMARPVVATVAIITFLLNWAQWFPVLIISSTPSTYTLPVALLNLGGELGINFQAVMAMAVVTTIPPVLVFLVARRQVIQGMTDGAVKG